jgi:hypothetical protein
MKLRIATDTDKFPETGLYWIENLVDGEWKHVFSTMSFSAGGAWEAYEWQQKQKVVEV